MLDNSDPFANAKDDDLLAMQIAVNNRKRNTEPSISSFFHMFIDQEIPLDVTEDELLKAFQRRIKAIES